MRVYAPGIAQIFDRIFPDFYTEKENESIKKLFPTCESISIDYAVMEKAQEIYVLPASFGWSDLGTWGALRGLLPQDKSGNAMVGTDIRLYESKNCIVHTSEEKHVVIQGLDGYIIAEKDDTLLINWKKNRESKSFQNKNSFRFLIFLWRHSCHSLEKLTEKRRIREVQFIRNLIDKQVAMF